jgi:hypothetical protein
MSDAPKEVPVIGYQFTFNLDENDVHSRNTVVVQTHVASDQASAPVLTRVLDAVDWMRKRNRLHVLRNDLIIARMQIPNAHQDLARIKQRAIETHQSKKPGTNYRPSEKDKNDEYVAQVTIGKFEDRVRQIEELILQYEEAVSHGPDGGADHRKGV